jgi:hypothetical protein
MNVTPSTYDVSNLPYRKQNVETARLILHTSLTGNTKKSLTYKKNNWILPLVYEINNRGIKKVVDIEERYYMEEKKNIEVRREEKTDNSLVGATFIKYAAYIIIFFGFLWFLIKFIFPMF